MSRYRVIGTSPPRADAWEKVRGRPIYAGDFAPPGMLHGRIVRSPYASARIARVDIREAAELPGVRAVLTHRDVPRNQMRMELPGRMAEATAGAVLATQPVLAEERVRFQGEPVVAIAADTPEIATAAAERVRVQYEPLPGVYDPLAALAPGAPAVHEGGNVLRRWHLRSGSTTIGFGEAEVVVERTYRTPFVDHVYLETESGVGWVDAEGVLTLRVSTQVLEHFRDVADVLALPHSRVRLEGAYLGGGFGGKEDVTVECLLGLLVWRTRRPVQLVFSREESFIGHGKRHPYVLRYRTGATRAGALVALEAELISDSGAYAALSPWVLFYSLVTATGPYRIPHVAVDAVTVYTNNPVASAYRTFGSIQTCIAYESQMDALAEALGMDPLELRERNFVRQGDRLATGQVLETEPMLAETMRRAWAGLGPARAAAPPWRRARGLAASFTPYGRMCWTRDSASAWIGMELDGTAVVRCAAPDVGGGQSASLCSITAEVLGLDVTRVSVVGRDSHFTPRAGTTTATRQLLMSGNAVLRAAQELRRHLVDQAADMLEVAGADVELREGRAAVRGAPDRAVEMAALVRAATAAGRPVQVLEKYDAPFAPTIDPHTGQGKPFNDYTFGTQAVEVEIDEETGQTRVARLAACYDIGQAIHRQGAEGQIEGGAVQGLGHALMEEVLLEEGRSRNPHLLDYRIPTSLDAPEIETILLESGHGLGPFGAKGIGEPAMTPTPAAVMNAVSRAAGARVSDLPLTAERVLAALRSGSPPHPRPLPREGERESAPDLPLPPGERAG
ncbi:MAG: xanthine dehydrogenase family protein molybdopterin-binding subunit [Candidatus Rokubacteria bacterium]|nr:xanthine dehydrogenase family protein molybdopterin-binding subunit [Candidatus Rokubacteria bacterium]